MYIYMYVYIYICTYDWLFWQPFVSLYVSLCLSVSFCVFLCPSASLCVSLCLSVSLSVFAFPCLYDLVTPSLSLCRTLSSSYSCWLGDTLSMCVSVSLRLYILCPSLTVFFSLAFSLTRSLSIPHLAYLLSTKIRHRYKYDKNIQI